MRHSPFDTFKSFRIWYEMYSAGKKRFVFSVSFRGRCRMHFCCRLGNRWCHRDRTFFCFLFCFVFWCCFGFLFPSVLLLCKAKRSCTSWIAKLITWRNLETRSRYISLRFLCHMLYTFSHSLPLPPSLSLLLSFFLFRFFYFIYKITSLWINLAQYIHRLQKKSKWLENWNLTLILRWNSSSLLRPNHKDVI